MTSPSTWPAALEGTDAAYLAYHPDLAMLRLRMSGGAAAAGSLGLMSSLLPAASVPAGPAIEPPLAMPSTPEEAAIAALLVPPQPTTTVAKKNPCAAFLMGTFICLVFFVIVAVVTLTFA